MTLNQAYNAARPEMRSDRLALDLENARTALRLLQAENDKLREALLRARDHVMMSGTRCDDAPETLVQINAALKVTP